MFGLFGFDYSFEALNHIVLLAKRTIFHCRYKDIKPNLAVFLALLRKTINIEEFLAKQKDTLYIHLNKWEIYSKFLTV